jgi:cytochrome b involved in lipid metabolism
VTKFLNDHPGGAEVMLEVAGQDATVQFDDIGHSEKAKQQIVEKCIFKGKLVGAPENLGRAGAGHSGGVGVSQVMLPIVGMVLLAYAVQTLM